MRRNILGVKGHSSLDIFFSPSLLPSSFALLTLFSFFCCVCTRLHFGGKWFGGQAFRVVVLDDAKRGWVVEQDFCQLYMDFAFFSDLLD